MVQRKPVDKVGTQAESKNHVKSEKKSSSQYQDVRNKGGGDLMKKTKRARSFKLSNSESLGSRKEHLRPNKISGDVSISTTPLRKPSPIKKSDGSSPNYMKATSSSDTRKERLQVSPTSQTADKSRSPKELCVLKPPSSSGHKSIKILRKNSSLKPVRPSMKISGITLYPKPNVDRATCSSTLKDSKFPPYVDLNPGGTQLEGTSVKVCPYTYCSLNGHHHKPSPPLMRFLSARRRLLRTQKSMNFKGMSTPKMKDFGANKKEIDADQIEFNKYRISLQADSEDPEISPLIEDECTDFFIKIYAKPREEIVEIERNSHFGPSVKDYDEISLSENDGIACGYSQPNGIEMEEDGGVAEGQLDETHLETSLEDNLDKSDNSESESNGLVSTEFDNGDKQFEAHDTEIDFKCYKESVLDGENLMDESDSEGSEMYWEEHLGSYEDVYGTDLSQIFDDEYDQDTMSSQKNEHAGVHNEVVIVPKNAELLEEVFDEDTESYSSGCDEGDSNLDDGKQSSEVEVSGEGIGETAEQQEEASEDNEETKQDKGLLSENAFLGNHDELTDGIPVAFIVLVEEQENNPPQDDLIKNCGVLPEEQSLDKDNDAHLMLEEDDAEAIVGLFEDAKSLYQVHISGSNCLYESNEDITDEEPRPHQTHMETEVQQSDAVTDENAIDLNSACIGETAEEQDEACEKNGEIKQDKGFLPENAFFDNLDELTDGSSAAFEVLVEEQEDDLVRDVLAEDQSSDEDNDAQVMSEEIEDEAIVDLCEDSNSLSQVQISGSNDWSESDEDRPIEEPRPDETHMGTELRESDGITDENVIDLNSSILDQDAPGIDEHVSDNQPVTDCIIKEQQDSVKDHAEVGSIAHSSISYEESSYSQRNKSSSPGECSKEDETVKTEVSITSQEEDKATISMELDFSQPLPEAHINANKLYKRMGRRVTEEDEDHLKKFNPRAPRFLTLEPEPDPENVDLRHQMMDEKKDAEEWMLDFALRQVVNKLGPSRKKRVSLLVEAFETVMPTAKYETPVSFAHARTIQACN